MVNNEILNTNSVIFMSSLAMFILYKKKLRIKDTNLTNAMLQGYLFLGILTTI